MERADFSGSRGDEEGWGRYGDKKRNAKGQMLVGVFLKRMEMPVVNTSFKESKEH